jgi:hypothetical protein
MSRADQSSNDSTDFVTCAGGSSLRPSLDVGFYLDAGRAKGLVENYMLGIVALQSIYSRQIRCTRYYQSRKPAGARV